MTQAQREHLERRLLQERERVLRSLGGHEERFGATEQEASGDLSKIPLHLADEGTDTMQQELDASLAARESRELGEIDEALRRLYREPQRFGLCEDTGEEIPFERLDIVPWARTCSEAGAA
jgi:DnaK suppressor protein